jgi:L-ascorbate metabolism protein UlaG (beta-lactamase superfamily)
VVLERSGREICCGAARKGFGWGTFMAKVSVTLIGGPTALLEVGGFRLLTDPTFDAPGEYTLPHVTLRKIEGPAVSAEAIGAIDAVLLSHDQHADNLDHSGKAFLTKVGHVFTTVSGAKRLGSGSEGLASWETRRLVNQHGKQLQITATPARHGPAGIEPFSGEVIGFVLTAADDGRPIYITGDTVWYEGVAEVARRFRAGLILLFAGAAQTRGPFHLTMNANDAIETAHAFPDALIVPVHHAGWAHFTQSERELEQTFSALGIRERLQLVKAGVATQIEY